MATYQLAPKVNCLDHRDWAVSTHQQDVLVGAENEKQAREIAEAATCIMAKVDRGPMRFSPWLQEHLTTCEQISKGSGAQIPIGKVRIAGITGIVDPWDL